MNSYDRLPAASLTRRQWMTAAATTIAGLTVGARPAHAALDTGLGLIHTADAIHQETVFKVGPKRIYEALLDELQFQKIQILSGAVPPAELAKTPAKIDRTPGGSFTLFAGYIEGRQIELIAGQRIVQAWRAADWPAGVYSIAKFELKEQPGGTMLLFDQTGFPASDTELAPGWKAHYWEPMAKFLA